jgi:hypothetical protein
LRYRQTVLVSCEIPWDDKYRLMEDVFRQEVRHTLSVGFPDLYVFGTAGEGYAVTNEQFKQIIQIFWEETNQPNVYPQVGVIALSTPVAVERIGRTFHLDRRADRVIRPVREPAGGHRPVPGPLDSRSHQTADGCGNGRRRIPGGVGHRRECPRGTAPTMVTGRWSAREMARTTTCTRRTGCA